MNRRDFFAAVTSAVVAASAGIALRPDQKKLVANYRQEYDIHRDRVLHRFDVRADGNVYYIDGMTKGETLEPDQVEAMLDCLSRYIGEEVTIAAA